MLQELFNKNINKKRTIKIPKILNLNNSKINNNKPYLNKTNNKQMTLILINKSITSKK